MPNKYAEIFFTETVQSLQRERGSHHIYGPQLKGADTHFALTLNEQNFIEARDSFYLASITEDSWPYVQHRGGPPGFLKILNERTLGFADFSGNMQFMSAANFKNSNRVMMFLMDYVNRRRLKIAGLVTVIDNNDPRFAQLDLGNYRATPERGIIIEVQGFDWNCPQHITQRFDKPTVDRAVEQMLATIDDLKKQVADLTDQLNQTNQPKN
ncbi:pyridoxamine 5'-phosphate oxidase family protein [Sessilibacter sp. MAH4]